MRETYLHSFVNSKRKLQTFKAHCGIPEISFNHWVICSALVQILDVMKSVALEETRWYKKILTCEAIKEKITDCNNLLNHHVERFQVPSPLRKFSKIFID